MIPDWFFKTCFRREIHLLLCLVTAGCTSIGEIDANDSILQIKGKIVVSNDDVKKIFRYRFQGNENNGSLAIWSLIGVTAFEFRIIENRIFYLAEKTKEPILYSEETVKNYLGFDFPFELAWFWIRGTPEPNRDFKAIEFSDRGDLIGFEQFGWTVSQKTDSGAERELKGGGKKIKIKKGSTQLLITAEIRI